MTPAQYRQRNLNSHHQPHNNNCQDWLAENGIDKSRLTSRGFGESQPLMTNDTRDGRERNRRVEINLNKN